MCVTWCCGVQYTCPVHRRPLRWTTAVHHIQPLAPALMIPPWAGEPRVDAKASGPVRVYSSIEVALRNSQRSGHCLAPHIFLKSLRFSQGRESILGYRPVILEGIGPCHYFTVLHVQAVSQRRSKSSGFFVTLWLEFQPLLVLLPLCRHLFS